MMETQSPEGPNVPHEVLTQHIAAFAERIDKLTESGIPFGKKLKLPASRVRKFLQQSIRDQAAAERMTRNIDLSPDASRLMTGLAYVMGSSMTTLAWAELKKEKPDHSSGTNLRLPYYVRGVQGFSEFDFLVDIEEAAIEQSRDVAEEQYQQERQHAIEQQRKFGLIEDVGRPAKMQKSLSAGLGLPASGQA